MNRKRYNRYRRYMRNRRKKNKYRRFFKRKKIFIFRKKNVWRDLFVNKYKPLTVSKYLLKHRFKPRFNKFKKRFAHVYKKFTYTIHKYLMARARARGDFSYIYRPYSFLETLAYYGRKRRRRLKRKLKYRRFKRLKRFKKRMHKFSFRLKTFFFKPMFTKTFFFPVSANRTLIKNNRYIYFFFNKLNKFSNLFNLYPFSADLIGNSFFTYYVNSKLKFFNLSKSSFYLSFCLDFFFIRCMYWI